MFTQKFRGKFGISISNDTIADVKRKARTRLSTLALRTNSILFSLLFGVALFLGALYIVLANHIAFRGHVLQREAQSETNLKAEIAQIEARIAQIESQQKLSKLESVKFFVDQKSHKFVQLQSPVRAQR